MIEIVPAKFEHVKELLSIPHNQPLAWALTPHTAANVENPYAKTVLIDGQPVFTAGLLPYWKFRAEAWALFRPGHREHFYTLHKEVKRFLDSCPFRRIEAIVEFEFENGHRWIRALGFTLEAPRLKLYFPDGKDASLYALIK